MTPTERREFWTEKYVEIDVDIAALAGANGQEEIQDIRDNITRLGDELPENLENVFINLYFLAESTHDTNKNIYEVRSILLLKSLIDKLATFQRLNFTVVTLHTKAAKDVPCLYEWLDHASPFCDLPFNWHLSWWPGWDRKNKPHKIYPGSDNYIYVNKRHRVLCRERERFLGSVQHVIPSQFHQ
jgi:hypothetical protein